MPLEWPFARRIAGIQAFAELPPFRVLELHRPPDLEVVLRRLLTRLAAEPADPHAWVRPVLDFRGYRAFFQAVVDAVAADVGRAAADLADLGVVAPLPPALSGEGGATEWGRSAADYLGAVAEALPPDVGSLVVVLEPREVSDRAAYGWALGALAWYQRSNRAKVIAVDGGPAPLIPTDGGVEERVIRLDFAVPPEEFDAQVAADLDGGRLDAATAGRYGLLAGAFATSAGRFAEAEGRLNEALEAAGREGGGGEEANVLYNLGNLRMRTRRFEEATESLGAAARAALDERNHGLAAMALTNLGVSLVETGRGGEAGEAFRAARGLFRALGHVPGEAHVVDCTASAWARSDPERARALWTEARGLYESITAPHLASVREAGIEDVTGKLASLGRGAD